MEGSGAALLRPNYEEVRQGPGMTPAKFRLEVT